MARKSARRGSLTGGLLRPAVVVAGCVVMLGCAPYRMGIHSLYSCNVRTVYVPMFESDSYRRNLGERLTEAVQKEIERRTPYKVVGTPDADSVLTGRLLTDTKAPSVLAPTDEPRELQTYFSIQVSWIDRNGVEMQPMQAIPLPATMVSIFNNGQFYPEVGQSISTAQQEAINQLARQIVGLMEAPW
jgi:hypothetical protein